MTPRSHAVHTLMAAAGRAIAARDRRDWVAQADARTSTHDARIALCLAIGVPVEEIDSCTGNDRRLAQDVLDFGVSA